MSAREPLIPGEIRTLPGQVTINENREVRTVVVTNDGDRPVQVGSHFHFAEVNDALSFDRESASGFRLDIAAGTSARFEPGASRTVQLVRFGGRGVVPGLRARSARDA